MIAKKSTKVLFFLFNEWIYNYELIVGRGMELYSAMFRRNQIYVTSTFSVPQPS